MLMAERFLPLLLLLLSSNQAFQACLNKACLPACLPGRGWIPLWPFALWPKVHSVCKVRNSSEVQLMGVSFSSFGVCSRPLEVEKTSSMYTYRAAMSYGRGLLFKESMTPTSSYRASINFCYNPVGSWLIDLMGDIVEWKWGSGVCLVPLLVAAPTTQVVEEYEAVISVLHTNIKGLLGEFSYLNWKSKVVYAVQNKKLEVNL